MSDPNIVYVRISLKTLKCAKEALEKLQNLKGSIYDSTGMSPDSSEEGAAEKDIYNAIAHATVADDEDVNDTLLEDIGVTTPQMGAMGEL